MVLDVAGSSPVNHPKNATGTNNVLGVLFTQHPVITPRVPNARSIALHPSAGNSDARIALRNQRTEACSLCARSRAFTPRALHTYEMARQAPSVVQQCRGATDTRKTVAHNTTHALSCSRKETPRHSQQWLVDPQRHSRVTKKRRGLSKNTVPLHPRG